MSRYDRQMILPEVGAAGQARLGAAHVVVVGAGGLASTALPLLAAAGMGRITIADGDRVDLSNLHRQTLFTEADQGRSKAETAAERCRALNDTITVTDVPSPVTPANVPGVIDGADIVLDCADSHAVSFILSDACVVSNQPLISASVLRLSGYVGGFCGGAPSLRAVFPEAPDNAASCATAGVLPPVVAILGAMQAQMAMAVILCLEPSPLGRIVQVDARTCRTNAFRFDTAPEPADHFAFAAASSLAEEDLIVDLRSADEAPDPIHADAIRILPDCLGDLTPTNTRLALCCATGLRAWRAAEQMKHTWPGEIVLVAASAS